MLKADLHIHTREDPIDVIDYTAKQLIDHCSGIGLDVIAITNHDSQFYNPDIDKYAKQKGIVLIPGVERLIEGKHILILNVDPKKSLLIDKIKDLKKLRSKESLIIAPHPFFLWWTALSDILAEHISLFDAVEVHSLYCSFYNPNKKALKVAKKNNIPLVANTDAHFLFQLGRNYSLIDSEKTRKEVIKAIKMGKVTYHSRPMSMDLLIKNLFIMAWLTFRSLILNRNHYK